MMTFIYWSIVAYLLGMTVWTLLRESKLLLQINCVMVIIALLLRVTLIK